MNGRFEYDVALSFAGEQRDHVEKVAAALCRRGIRPFYDDYEKVNLWGKDLYEHLDWIYQKASQYCVIFVSKDYAKKVWTTHERRSARARALQSNQEYVLPVRFDDTEIPGLRSTVGYVDVRSLLPEKLAELIFKKLGPRAVESALEEKLRISFSLEQPSDEAHALHVRGAELYRAGHVTQAVDTLEAAVMRYRSLPDAASGSVTSGLAAALCDLGVWIGATQAGGARATTQRQVTLLNEAVRLYRTLADADAEQFEPYLAEALSRISACHLELYQFPEAEEAARNAVGLRRNAAHQDPEPLALALYRHAHALLNQNRHGRAVQVMREALARYADLAGSGGVGARQEFADALTFLGVICRQPAWSEVGISALVQAAQVFRSLVSEDPIHFEPALTRVLRLLDERRSSAGESGPEVATMAQSEVDEICSRRGDAGYVSSLATKPFMPLVT